MKFFYGDQVIPNDFTLHRKFMSERAIEAHWNREVFERPISRVREKRPITIDEHLARARERTNRQLGRWKVAK